MSRFFIPCAVLLILASGVKAAGPPSRSSQSAPSDSVSRFDRVVAPLLVRYCLDCHGSEARRGGLDLRSRKSTLAGGDNGPALVPGKPEESYLYQRIRDNEMPPKKPMPAADRAVLQAWIAGGATWGSDPIDPFRLSTEKRAGLDWWSLQPIRRPSIPAVKDREWVRNPIDAFILARLEARGLTPSPQADRRTLLRRLTTDLTGMPPTTEELEAFLGDRSRDADHRVVNRLLASPHHGERWARHWLDVVRFGESDGFERDLPRLNAWPYRDWVIEALNSDLPYDEFVRLQLAGDILHPEDPASLAATGFLVAGAHDIVVPVSKNMRDTMRQDELEDVVATVGQSFLGLTVNCARCHEHKFDPVSQKDYYRLASALSGIGHGERSVLASPDRERIAHLRRSADELTTRLVNLEAPARKEALAARGKEKSSAGPRPLAEWDFRAGLRDTAGTLHATLHGSAKQDSDGLHVDGRTGYAATLPLSADLREKTLEVWVKLANLTQRGGGVISVQTNDGNTFDAIVFGEQQPGRWMSGSNFFARTTPFNAPAETEADKQVVHLAITYAADGTITGYRNGGQYGVPYRATGPITFTAGKAQVVFGLRHGPVGGNKMLSGTVVRARLHARALTAEEVAASAGSHVTEAEILARLSSEDRTRRKTWSDELQQTNAELRRLNDRVDRKLYAIVPLQPEPTAVLKRGSVTARGELVSAEPISALSRYVSAPTRKPDSPEAERRRDLADWLTRPDNPLFARVIVNRVWHWHFGSGLVETPNDLGFNGGRPSHPELLDWLTDELIRSGWSLKHLHRLIVTSATYQQSSAPRPEPMGSDADNRLLWRYNPRRLEAEAVRDAMLAVSGRLDRSVGGRYYQDFRTYFFKGTQFYDPVEQVGPLFSRRTLYRMWARGGRNPFLDTFDCPDPSTTTPRRSSTTTPLQALSLLNNALVLDLADALAERARREAGNDLNRQIDRVLLLVYGRGPEERERTLLTAFVQKHGLAALCRVVFNSNEFMQVD